MNKKLKRITNQDDEKEDRLSVLPDELIHQIQSFLETRLAVQTSVLSKRWRYIWTTLPFLAFDDDEQLFQLPIARGYQIFFKFIDHVLVNRNHNTPVFSFKFISDFQFPDSFMEELLRYPIEHNVQELDICLRSFGFYEFKLSAFSCNTIRKLKLRVPFDFDGLSESECLWDLPVLTTLHLICSPYSSYELPESCLICLPALTSLCLQGVKLPHSWSYSICLSALTTLCLVGVELPDSFSSLGFPITSLTMKRCKLPQTIWNFPNLLSLELDDVRFHENMSDFFAALVSLRNLTLIFTYICIQGCIISCPHLVSLKISTNIKTCICHPGKLVVVAPKLCELRCVGIFLVTLHVPELENVYIKLWDAYEFKNATMLQRKLQYCRFISMFSKLGSAKILTLDSATIEALSTVQHFFTHVASPFENLKYVKLAQRYVEAGISTTLRKYLLGGNPGATIVTTLPEDA